jgi:fructose-1,6-bisphosphatase/inositol monophosphatase family enzyme
LDIESIAASLQNVFMSTIQFWLTRQDWQVEHSAEGEPSTTVDNALESELRRLLGAIRPKAAFLAEEQFRAERRSLAQFAASEELWIVDPLDGTGNFITGSDDFGLIVAYARRAVTTIAWIIVPQRHLVCCAELGSGVRINGRRCGELGPGETAATGILATGDFAPAELEAAERLRARLTLSRGTRACAIDYIDLLEGAFDLALYKRTRPWDHAAGVLAYSEIGGQHMTFSGGSYNLFEDQQGLLLARSEMILEEVASILQIGADFSADPKGRCGGPRSGDRIGESGAA